MVVLFHFLVPRISRSTRQIALYTNFIQISPRIEAAESSRAAARAFGRARIESPLIHKDRHYRRNGVGNGAEKAISPYRGRFQAKSNRRNAVASPGSGYPPAANREATGQAAGDFDASPSISYFAPLSFYVPSIRVESPGALG